MARINKYTYLIIKQLSRLISRGLLLIKTMQEMHKLLHSKLSNISKRKNVESANN